MEAALRLRPDDAAAMTEAGLASAAAGDSPRAVFLLARARAMGVERLVTLIRESGGEPEIPGPDVYVVHQGDAASRMAPRVAEGLRDQGIDREPTVHVGPAVSGMERRGIETEVGNRIREEQRIEIQQRLEAAAELGLCQGRL